MEVVDSVLFWGVLIGVCSFRVPFSEWFLFPLSVERPFKGGEEANPVYSPFVCAGEDAFFNFSADDLPGHCSRGRITKALGFSLGIKRASAFGVLVVSSSSLKNETFGPSFFG